MNIKVSILLCSHFLRHHNQYKRSLLHLTERYIDDIISEDPQPSISSSKYKS